MERGRVLHVARGLGEPKIYSLQRRHTHVINFYFRFSQQGAPPVSPGRCKCSLSSSKTIIIGLHGVRLGSAWLGLGFDWARSPRTLHIAACIKLNVRAASPKLLCLLRSGRVSVCVRVCVRGLVWPCLAWPGIFNERIVWAAVIYSLLRAAALK